MSTNKIAGKSWPLLSNTERALEVILLFGVILLALYVGFYDPENLTHPLHKNLVFQGNIASNLANDISFETQGILQWTEEQIYYLGTSALYLIFSSFFWENSQTYIENLTPPTAFCALFTYFVAYFFARRFLGVRVALMTLLFMALSSFWYNGTLRGLNGAWASLPGFTLLFCWLVVQFLETQKRQIMFYTGLLAGVAFYFTSWPLAMLVFPSILVSTIILPSSNTWERRFFSCFLFCAGLGLVLTIMSGKYAGASVAGLVAFLNIFPMDIGIGERNLAVAPLNYSLPTFIPSIRTLLKNIYELFFHNGLGVTPLVVATFLPGLVWMYFQEKLALKVLAIFFLLICAIAVFITEPVRPKYLLPVWPILFMGSAFFITKLTERIKVYPYAKPALILVVAAGFLYNGYVTKFHYMDKTLPSFSQFESNCDNSIEWPFEALNKILINKNLAYDLIVKPNNLSHPEMDAFFRWDKGKVRPEGGSYGHKVISYEKFRERLVHKKEALGKYYRILLITDNYASLIKDIPHCRQHGTRFPYDSEAISIAEVEELLPQAKFVQYVGPKNYPEMLAVYETAPVPIPNLIEVPSFWVVRPESIFSEKVKARGSVTEALSEELSAYLAFDGDKGTYWVSPPPAGVLGWLEQEFSKPQKVSMLSLQIRPDSIDQAPTELVISGSTDANNWKALGIARGLKWRADENKLLAFSKLPEAYRYFRVEFLESMRNEYTAVAELQWHHEGVASLKKPSYSISETARPNSFPGKIPFGTALSNGSYSDDRTPAGQYGARNAFDGNKNTFWISPQPGGTLGWIGEKFHKPQDISLFSLSISPNNESQSPIDFRVLVSADGMTWESVGVVEHLRWKLGETKHFAFDKPIEDVKAIKFDFLKSSQEAHVAIRDMELYGNP